MSDFWFHAPVEPLHFSVGGHLGFWARWRALITKLGILYCSLLDLSPTLYYCHYCYFSEHLFNEVCSLKASRTSRCCEFRQFKQFASDCSDVNFNWRKEKFDASFFPSAIFNLGYQFIPVLVSQGPVPASSLMTTSPRWVDGFF